MNKRYLVTLYLGVVVLFMMGFVMAIPSGANVTQFRSSSAVADVPTNDSAMAGNVTEVNIFGTSVTQSWQGYYGNVSGLMILADSSNNIMYNWSQMTAIGEVLATTNSTISWSSVQCINFTSELMTNLTILETRFGINNTNVDGVDETFNLNNHASFLIGSKSFGTGVCNNTKIFDNTGTGVFDEVLLYDNSTSSVIFTSILDDNTVGFDSTSHDFEMLVLENGHLGDTSGTPYNFYVELG